MIYRPDEKHIVNKRSEVNMSTDELITLMELLRKYETEKVDPCIKRRTENKLELMASFSAIEHKKIINEICDCIVYDL